MEAQELRENDVRGTGKNGQTVEDHSDDDDDDPAVGQPGHQLEHRQSAGGASRNTGMGRSPLRVEQASTHRSAGDVVATKSRSSGGAQSGQGER